MEEPNPSAAVLLIGDELLSGRTRDSHLQTIAQFLAPLGVEIGEARVVSDRRDQIVDALNALRCAYDVVFTTGGIGPTHDDITADCVAEAFNVGIDIREDARAILQDWYDREDTELNDTRLRMARIPDGARLIANPVTGAPGFQMDNVFVMAGVPKIMRAMLEDIADRLPSGAVTASETLAVKGKREGDLADILSEAQARSPNVSVGSYPYIEDDGSRGVNIVLRSKDQDALERLKADLDRQLSSS